MFCTSPTYHCSTFQCYGSTNSCNFSTFSTHFREIIWQTYCFLTLLDWAWQPYKLNHVTLTKHFGQTAPWTCIEPTPALSIPLITGFHSSALTVAAQHTTPHHPQVIPHTGESADHRWGTPGRARAVMAWPGLSIQLTAYCHLGRLKCMYKRLTAGLRPVCSGWMEWQVKVWECNCVHVWMWNMHCCNVFCWRLLKGIYVMKELGDYKCLSNVEGRLQMPWTE